MTTKHDGTGEPLIAVFIDYENLALGEVGGKKTRFSIGLVLERLLEKGRIVYRRAYCDWSRYRRATRELHSHGVQMVDLPAGRLSGKNSADIHMVVDALDLCHSRRHIGVFALVTGDSDFSPLVQKLKELDRRVIGCGIKSSTSDLLVATCDEFIYYDDLVARASRRKRAARSKRKKDHKDEALDVLLEVVRSLTSDYDLVWGSMVKQTLSRLHPSFSPEQHGFSSFVALLQEAEARGLLQLEYDQGRGNYVVRT